MAFVVNANSNIMACSHEIMAPSEQIQENNSTPKVAILLCTYQGQLYLAEQLDSFSAQTYPNWKIFASDDGSTDKTLSILEEYKTKHGEEKLSIRNGPERGFSANFLSLACNINTNADYYAYSDQDDIWEKDKLERAVNWLLSVPQEIPALYCSRTRLVDAENQDIGLSPLFKKCPSFANSLMQNIGGGNTMVFNNSARKLLCEAGEYINIVSHDWWTYILITGCGGQVFYDQHPSIRYRQHNCNLIGTNSSWSARLVRIRKLLQGRFRNWNDRHIHALQQLRSKLSAENQEILDRFLAARNQWLLPRLVGLKKSGIHRQTLLGNFGLIFAAIFRLI